MTIVGYATRELVAQFAAIKNFGYDDNLVLEQSKLIDFSRLAKLAE